jgi:hypothetical protein
VAAFLGCLGTFVGVVFYGGKLVGRIESVADKFDSMQERLDAIPSIQQALVFQNERIGRLENRHDSTRAHAIRAEAISTHGE